MILWKPKIHHYGWYDMEQYMALHAKLAARHALATPPAAQPAQPKTTPRRAKGNWQHLHPDSPVGALLRFLDTYQRQHGEIPTNSEIAVQHFGNGPKTGHVSYCLSALEHGGWITRSFYVPRGITITDAGRASLEASLVGSEAS